MLLVGFLMASVVVDVELEACCRQRCVSEGVTHEPRIDLLIRHVRTRAVPHPPSGGLF